MYTRQLVKPELNQVDTLLAQQLDSNIELVQALGQHIINSGGKRIRPTLVLLTAKALEYQGQHHIQLAAIIELIHTATLLHDDVVDASHMRRGRKTANFIWGNQASVLVGDYLNSRSFQMMLTLENNAIMQVLADAANTIALGEVLQLLRKQNLSTSISDYWEIIQHKTAALFTAATKSAALLCQQNNTITEALANYGKHLGIAFQIIDDALDYDLTNKNLGKNIGDDLSEGKLTLPLIYALEHANADDKQTIYEAIGLAQKEQCNQHLLNPICKIIEATEAIAYTYDKASTEANAAIACVDMIPPSKYSEALKMLAKFAVERKY
jgi:octaprenyl-diphosphate synthase